MTTIQVSDEDEPEAQLAAGVGGRDLADDGIDLRRRDGARAPASCLSAAMVMARPRLGEGGRRAPFTGQAGGSYSAGGVVRSTPNHFWLSSESVPSACISPMMASTAATSESLSSTFLSKATASGS